MCIPITLYAQCKKCKHKWAYGTELEPCSGRLTGRPCFLSASDRRFYQRRRRESQSLFREITQKVESQHCFRCVENELYAIDVMAALYLQMQAWKEKGKSEVKPRVGGGCSSCGWDGDCARSSKSKVEKKQ